ncbi:chromosome segregation and condensation protein ScpA [gamma proteobacterium HTCC5015]|nr:chromosome segregation and condensation protein ScpA [gamma proteobacterium HTCC5015]
MVNCPLLTRFSQPQRRFTERDSALESQDPNQPTHPEDSAQTAEQGSVSQLVSAVSPLPSAPPESRLASYQQGGQQSEIPIALVQDEPMSVLPKDLYIPPEALMVILEAFEGPLDLLLYLIRRQNLDVLDIPIADITRQYMDYIALMQVLDLEVAAEYLVMAAMLAEIKSRMLLPRPVEEDDEEDPRAELVRRLQQYERYKKAAEDVDELPRMERDVFAVSAQPPKIERRQPHPDVDLRELLIAFQEVLQRADMFTEHSIRREPLSVRERMTIVLSRLSEEKFTDFHTLFTYDEGRMGVVVTFLAVLELVKESVIDFVQSEPFAPIYLKPAGSSMDMPAAAEGSEFD